MLTVIASMLIFALIGAISPGPVNIIATSAGANFGFIRTLPHVLGATLGYTLIVFLVGSGLNRLLAGNPQITNGLQYLGGGFLLYLSYKIANAQPQPLSQRQRSAPPRLLEGALAQLLNPKAWLVSMSGISLFVTSQQPAGLFLAIFCLVSFCMCLLGVGTWAGIGHLIRRYLSSPERQITFNRTMGLLLSGTVAVIFIS